MEKIKQDDVIQYTWLRVFWGRSTLLREGILDKETFVLKPE